MQLSIFMVGLWVEFFSGITGSVYVGIMCFFSIFFADENGIFLG